MKYLKILRFILFIAFSATIHIVTAQVTTGAINGRVEDSKGESLPGANIVAVHLPTGATYGTTTRSNGLFNLPNLKIGGPYTVTVSYLGFEATTKDNVWVSLGQDQNLNFQLRETGVDLSEVTVTANRNDLLRSDKAGTETKISEKQIESIPTVNRDVNDYLKLTPQASTAGDGISVAGVNNRYNSIFIDGAVNNDVFGLAASGTNGGQTGISPISIDAIEQFQVVVAPYDIRLGGFAGAGVNAVTRSGSNDFSGSAYYYLKNQDLAGKTPTDDPNVERKKLDDFNANLYGIRLGGPIIKNKLFFFVSGEIQRELTPKPFDLNTYQGSATAQDLQAFESKLAEFGYDAGGYGNNNRELESNKLLAKIDWNINKDHKLSLRHSYTYGQSLSPYTSSSSNIYFKNSGVLFPSSTHSSAIELNSLFGSRFSNNLIIGYTNVKDDRDPIGTDFPSIIIRDGSGTIYAGSEPFSTANQLNQKIFTLTDNFNIYNGKHTITIGTHNELYSMYNLFMRKTFGEYTYSSLAAFLNDANPSTYEVGYSLVDDVAGDGSEAAANFNAMQLGFYVQDKYDVNERLNLTFGMRVDIPVFLDRPAEDVHFNTVTVDSIQQYASMDEIYDLKGARAGKMPKSKLMLSPRIGFNYNLSEDRTTILRGGVGIFTSRIPFVWPAGAYSNNGLNIGGTFINNPNITFNPDPATQPRATDFGLSDAIPSGQMDLFVEDFKFPQVLRASLAIDQQLPWGVVGTLEGIYTKTLNNVVYYNLNVRPQIATTVGADERPVYDRSNPIDKAYTRIILADNTNEGHSYTITAQLQKAFHKGFTGSVAYTFGRSMAINDGTSSQNSSQWRYIENVRGKNYLDLTYSDFDLGHRVMAFVSYRKEYADNFASSISLFYNGQSGSRFSYIYRNSLVNDDSGEADLIYVPADQSEINFTGTTEEQEQQWQALNAFISNDEYLNSRRGQYAERNGARLPFENNIDLKFVQEFFINAGGKRNTLQLSLDIINFTNLLNKNWGRDYFLSNDNFPLIRFEEFKDKSAGDYTPLYSFNAPKGNIHTIDQFNSRWRMQLGIRYIFN